MLQLVCLLIIVPVLLGRFIKEFIKSNSPGFSFFYFALGFIVMIGEFALICYPAIFLAVPFHTVCYIVYGIYAVECLSILIWMIKTKRFSKKSLFSKDIFLSWIRSPAFWIMILMCSFQIIRLIVSEPSGMRDSKSYGALINDILQSDRLFLVQPENGFQLKSILDTTLKYSLSPWYPFVSMLAKASRIHPLIISNTILPGYLLLIHYIILYSLGVLILDNNKNEVFCFTALCAFIYEMTLSCHTPTMIKLVWPLWGKGVLPMTVVPALLVFYMLYTEKDSHVSGFRFLIVMIILVIAGCSMSTMAALELPLELGILGLIWTIRQRSARPLLNSILCCVPAVFYIGVYYYLSCLQNLR